MKRLIDANRILAWVLTLALLVSGVTVGMPSYASAETRPIRVFLNGTQLEFDVQPAVINERVLVPLRKIFESLGAQVEWVPATQEINAKMNDTTVNLQLQRPSITVSGNSIALDVAPVAINNRTLVPVRAVSEAFGIQVRWDAPSRSVLLGSGDPPPPIVSDKELRFNNNDANQLVAKIEGKQLILSGKFQFDDYEQFSVTLYVGKSPSTLEEYKGILNESLYHSTAPAPGDNTNMQLATGFYNIGADRKFSLTIDLPNEPYINVRTWGITSGDRYPVDGDNTRDWAALYEGQINIEQSNGNYTFKAPGALASNIKAMNTLGAPSEYLSTAHITKEEREAMQAVLDMILVGNMDDYAKLLRIHDFITNTMYYNYDEFEGKTTWLVHDPVNVLKYQTSQCWGYSILFSDMARMAGIPAIKAVGYLNKDPYKPLFKEDPSTLHAWIVAYANGRWIIIDPTVDSHNSWRDNTYTEDKPEHSYFDVSIEAFSITHGIDYFHESNIW